MGVKRSRTEKPCEICLAFIAIKDKYIYINAPPGSQNLHSMGSEELYSLMKQNQSEVELCEQGSEAPEGRKSTDCRIPTGRAYGEKFVLQFIGHWGPVVCAKFVEII